MELKNAISVCLISFFSASLVVLIARALDLHAASRLEPQLASIVQELRAIRAQGGNLPTSNSGTAAVAEEDCTIVYFFHGNTRCTSCRQIEQQAHRVVQDDFAEELAQGTLVWKTANYEDGSAAELATKFDILSSSVVLARVQDGAISNWKVLDRVWGLFDDEPAYAAFVRGEIQAMLTGPSVD
jgi:hypothetical protein